MFTEVGLPVNSPRSKRDIKILYGRHSFDDAILRVLIVSLPQ